ncbi:MAG TPA: hypothetical protein DCF72_13145 [Gammaproteobacteria bacterium]|nr:hypothetical protein [Gammaproteobacteria bacterium]
MTNRTIVVIFAAKDHKLFCYTHLSRDSIIWGNLQQNPLRSAFAGIIACLLDKTTAEIVTLPIAYYSQIQDVRFFPRTD